MKPATFPDLADASVFISGGGSGIGAALTEGFLRQGARVAFCQRSDGTPFSDAMEQATGNRPLFIEADVTDNAKLFAALDAAAEAHGPITRLVNNAASDDRHALHEPDEAYWRFMTDVNFKHYFFACQHVAPGMKAAGGGAIVIFTSVSYMMGNAGYPIYMACNSGLNGLTRGLARELGPDGIRVNAFAPGWIFTEKQEEMWATPDGVESHLARQCLPRKLRPEDMVGGVLFLASDASAAMTGQALVMDGGVAVTG